MAMRGIGYLISRVGAGSTVVVGSAAFTSLRSFNRRSAGHLIDLTEVVLMAFPSFIIIAFSVLFLLYSFERRDELSWGREQLLHYSLSMCAIVTILFIKIVWGQDWASGAATLAVIVSSRMGIWASKDRHRRWLGCGHMIEA